MRRIVMAACVLGLLICGSGSVAQTQSLKETTDWLHDFLPSREPLGSRDGNWRDIYQLVANGCEVTISLEVHDLSCLKPKNGCDGEAKEDIHRHKRVFNLKNMDLGRITVHPDLNALMFVENGATVDLRTFNDRPAVAYSFAHSDGEPFLTQRWVDDDNRHAFIVLSDREAADRVAKAFRRAVVLCGGQASPF